VSAWIKVNHWCHVVLDNTYTTIPPEGHKGSRGAKPSGSSWNLAFCGPKNLLLRLQNKVGKQEVGIWWVQKRFKVNHWCHVVLDNTYTTIEWVLPQFNFIIIPPLPEQFSIYIYDWNLQFLNNRGFKVFYNFSQSVTRISNKKVDI
jgi:hypothetical protein